MNNLTITKILESKTEAQDIKTIRFRHPDEITPGQYYMIWIPGVDEIPMSVSFIEKDERAITFRNVGKATSVLSSLKKGDRIGVRGPFGNGFHLTGKTMLFVGGGTGIAMLTPLIEQATKKGAKATVILGVKTKKELFFEERIQKTKATVYITTDDGSKGYKGFATEYAKQLLQKEKFSSVYTCGPEIMMKRLLGLCKQISFQASLERYMKCSIGLCGQCCIGHGLRVCKEGPVFDGETLQKTTDFGIFRRDASGRKIPF
jgi:dihydroorotate dehydrogenase electron transfer subunit